MKRTLAFLSGLISLFAQAQTNVTSNITSSTVWTPQNSPYVIKNNITIFQGATLTIMNGTEVQVDNGFWIDLRGGLILDGLPGDSVRIRSSVPSATIGSWYGIKFNASGKLAMNYSILKDSQYGVDYYNIDTNTVYTHKITHSRFTNNIQCISGVSLSRPKIVVSETDIHNNISGVGYGECGNVLLKQCRLFNNRAGIGDTNSYAISINVDGCEFFNNTVGARIYMNAPVNPMLLKNSLFHDNKTGLYLYKYGSPIDFSGNSIYNNAKGFICYSQASISDTLNGGNSSICSNTVNFENVAQRNFTLANICWCTNDSASIRAKIKDGYTGGSGGLVYFKPFVQNCQSALAGLQEASLQEGLVVYPNPTSGSLYFKDAGNYSGAELKLMDVAGRIVYSALLYKDPLDLSGIPPGLYVLTIQRNNETATIKLVLTEQ